MLHLQSERPETILQQKLQAMTVNCKQKTGSLRAMVKRQMRLGDRGNGRIKTTSLLTDDEKAEVSVNHAISRVIKGGVYTDVFNNYCPGLLTKYNLSAKSTRPMLFDTFKMFISDQPEHLKRVRIMDKKRHSQETCRSRSNPWRTQLISSQQSKFNLCLHGWLRAR